MARMRRGSKWYKEMSAGPSRGSPAGQTVNMTGGLSGMAPAGMEKRHRWQGYCEECGAMDFVDGGGNATGGRSVAGSSRTPRAGPAGVHTCNSGGGLR